MPLEQALSSITDFVYTFDLEGRFTYINRSLLELWGMTLDQAVGKNFFELPYPEDLAQRLQEQIQQVITSKQKIVDETRYDAPDGTIGYYQYIFSPVIDADGEVIAVAGTTRNISEIRRLEREGARNEMAMAAGKSNLEEVINRAPSFIAVLAGPNHVIEMANDLYLELVGRTDIVGKPIREALPEIEGQGFFELIDDVFETGEPYAGMESEVEVGPAEARKKRLVNFIYQALRGPTGEVTSVFVHGIDVTDSVTARRMLERTQHTLASQRRLYEAILSNTPDLAYVFDLNHRFIYANDILLKMWGCTEDEAIGKNCLELGYEPWHAEMHDREIEAVVATKQPVRGEVPFTGTFGRRMYDYIFVPVLDSEGNVEAVAGTTRDISDYVDLRDQISAQSDAIAKESKRKDEFLAMLSHELRNPLASIVSAVQLLNLQSDSTQSDISVKAREIIGRQVNNLTKMVDDLLEVSRVLSGRIRLDSKPTELNQIVLHAVETAQPFFDVRQHSLTVQPFDHPVMVDVDLTRMEEVLVNLLNNAAKYTNSNGEIVVRCECPDSNTACIRIEDNGLGIDPDLLPEIFDLFTQADRSLDHSGGGLGVGLSLAQRLVQLHGGTLEAESPRPDGKAGSVFTVRLPVSSSAEFRPEPNNGSRIEADPGMRILLVDDNVDYTSMMSSALAMMGFEVRTAFDGLEAVRLATEWVPDVTLLDIGLPGMDGYEVARRIRSHSSTSRIKIVAVSGYANSSDLTNSEAAGIDAHLSKPLELAELERRLLEFRPLLPK